MYFKYIFYSKIICNDNIGYIYEVLEYVYKYMLVYYVIVIKGFWI